MHTFVLVPFNFLTNDHFDHDGEENSCKSNWLLTDLGFCFRNCFCWFVLPDLLSTYHQHKIETKNQNKIFFTFFTVLWQSLFVFLRRHLVRKRIWLISKSHAQPFKRFSFSSSLTLFLSLFFIQKLSELFNLIQKYFITISLDHNWIKLH